MTTYSKTDIRAADMLAVTLSGLGILLLAFAAFETIGKGAHPSSNIRLWLSAGVFLPLGLALNFKIRQLVRNQGTEPVGCDGVQD